MDIKGENDTLFLPIYSTCFVSVDKLTKGRVVIVLK